MASIQSKKGRNGKKTYYVVVSLQGKHKWIRAGTQQQAKILKKDIESLQDSQKIEKLGLTRTEKRIDDFFTEYVEYVTVRTSPNTVKRYRAAINAFLAFLNMFHPRMHKLSQIKQEHIEEYQLRRLDSIELKTAADGDKPGNHKNKKVPKPQTVNFEVSVLRSAFLWAFDRELIPSVPTKKVKKLRPEPTREARVLTPQDCKLLLKTARGLAKENSRMSPFPRVFKFLLNTGLRSGELCNLTWNDVDLETGLIRIRPKPGWTPKSYSRDFFMNEEAIKVLRALAKDQGEYVFQSSTNQQLDTDTIRKALIDIAKAAEIAGLTRVHDLRHTFNSLMQMNGVDPATMGKILGHKDIETTMIYTHQTEEHLKKSANKLGIG
jgi:integrase